MGTELVFVYIERGSNLEPKASEVDADAEPSPGLVDRGKEGLRPAQTDSTANNTAMIMD